MSHRPSPDPKSSMWGLIAWYLRICRNQWGLTGPLMGEILECSAATLSRLETGDIPLDEKRAHKIDTKRDTGGLFGLLVWYARLGHNPDWKRQHLDLEGQADVIKTYEDTVVPGLLQIPEYAYALFEAVVGSDMEALVERRMARQAVLLREPPPMLWLLLSQNVLDWPIGGRDVMRRQLARLLEASESYNIGIRVLPRSAGAHAGVDGSFRILSGPFGDIAYSASPGGGRLVQAVTEVRSFGIRYDRIGQRALHEDASRDLIKQAMETM